MNMNKHTNRKERRASDRIAERLVKHLRPYQARMEHKQDLFMTDPVARRATILAATGSGKTELFIVLIKKLVLLAEKYGLKKVLIAHPRLALSADQQKRLKKSFIDFSVEFTSFHSGECKDTSAIRKGQATTSREELIQIQDSCEDDLHITFSTYKSLHKIADIDYDLIVNDEAHYLCQNQYAVSLDLFNDETTKVLNYTATPVDVELSEDATEETKNLAISMRNEALFGKVIATVEPKELIPYGYVVKPRVRVMNITQKKQNDTMVPDYAKAIAEAYKDQLTLVDKRFNHKMLTAMPRTTEFDNIIADLGKMREILDDYDVDVYTVKAEEATINGRLASTREAALDHFAKNKNKCIIIHCNTLAEGIDVDGIGGVFLLKNLDLATTIQTIGRAARPAKQDILADGTINMKDRVKTEAIVTIATVDGEWASNMKTEMFAKAFKLGGYEDLWSYVDPEYKTPGNGEVKTNEYEDIAINEIEDIAINDGANELRELMNKTIKEEQNA